jgi:hypothetical protein
MKLILIEEESEILDHVAKPWYLGVSFSEPSCRRAYSECKELLFLLLGLRVAIRSWRTRPRSGRTCWLEEGCMLRVDCDVVS